MLYKLLKLVHFDQLLWSHSGFFTFINWLRYNKDDVIKESNKGFSWKWKGQAIKHGSLVDLNKDKAKFDKQGFEFKIIANGN